ncbi:MAG: HepT-like ribonuclease domain-containing protein [Candidatus Natronoplasma sp.]
MVEDDYTNIERLREKRLLDREQEGLMKESNGLRNRLVHEYNGLEKKIALESIKRTNSKVVDILEVVKGWLKKQ